MSIIGRLAVYKGGGYLAELGDNLLYAKAFINYLKRSEWIDMNTRAVFVEGSMYNPSVNLLAVLKVSVEFTATGAAVPTFNINIMSLYRSLSPGYTLFVTCEFIYTLILVQLLYSIIRGIYKERKQYFSRVLSWMDVVFFLNGIVVISLYIVRARFVSQAVDILSKDQVSYIGFADLAAYVEMVVYLLALADFIAILKFLHFLSFTRSVKLLSETIFRCFVQLQSFSVLFFVTVMAYAVLAYTVFGAYLDGYMDVSSTIGSLFSLLMGVFDHEDFELQSDFKVLGRFFFSTFSSVMLFLFMNFFITIINFVYKEVQSDDDLKKNEYDLFASVFNKILITTGIQAPPKREIPVIEEQTTTEIQWDFHVQYILNSQMRRLRKHVNSLKADDGMWDLYLTEYMRGQMMPKNVSEIEGERGPEIPTLRFTESLPGNPDVLPGQSTRLPVNAVRSEEWLEDTSTNEEPAVEQCHSLDSASFAEYDSQSNEETIPAEEASNNEEPPKDGSLEVLTHEQETRSVSPQVEKLRNLISKKEKELQMLESEGKLDENERTRQVKIISCLEELLDRALLQDERRFRRERLAAEDDNESIV